MKFNSLIFTGDLALLGLAESTDRKDYSLNISPEIRELFLVSELNVVNLETPLTTSTSKIPKTGPHVKAHPQSIGLLKDLNVHVACLSNNHIRDFGNVGVKDTIEECTKSGIRIVGAGENLTHAAQPLFIEQSGFKVCIVNFSESEYNFATNSRAGSNPDDPIHIWKTFKEIEGKADYIIAVMHGGREMHPYPTPYQLELYRFVIDLGAHAVIGHHSHVIAGYEWHKNKPIFHSLGNFIFDEAGEPNPFYEGMLVQLQLPQKKDGNIDFMVYKTLLEDGNLQIVETIKNNELNPDSFLKPIEESEVYKQWDMLIEKGKRQTVNGILNNGLWARFYYKYINPKLRKRDIKPLLSGSNRLRCKTHREFALDTVLKIFEYGEYKGWNS